MSRYPDETTARFDQQFVETTAERNARLRDRREQRALAAIEAHREWGTRRKVLEEAAAACNELALGMIPMGPKIACWACADKIVALIGPEPTDGR